MRRRRLRLPAAWMLAAACVARGATGLTLGAALVVVARGQLPRLRRRAAAAAPAA